MLVAVYFPNRICQLSIARLYKVSLASLTDPSALAAAQEIQGIIARADYTIAKSGVSGTKWLVEKLYGYGGSPRKPLPPFDLEDGESLWEHPHVKEIVALERELGGKFA